MAQSVFRAVAGSIEVNWSKAGHKTYKGLALLRESEAGITLGMFHASDKMSGAEYRSLAAAASELAVLADQCATAVETARAEQAKLDKATVERVREALKNQKPADRLALVISLAIANVNVKLSDYGYDDATGKPVADKKPTPPTGNPAADAILAAAGK